VSLQKKRDEIEQVADDRLSVGTLLFRSGDSAAIEGFKEEIIEKQRSLSQLLGEAERRKGTCVVCLDRLPTVCFFPCMQQCVCESCWEDMCRKRRRGKALRCPACNQVAEYASNLAGVKTTT